LAPAQVKICSISFQKSARAQAYMGVSSAGHAPGNKNFFRIPADAQACIGVRINLLQLGEALEGP
jgi:hypothetical protein